MVLGATQGGLSEVAEPALEPEPVSVTHPSPGNR